MDDLQHPPGLRLVPRPRAVVSCGECGRPSGAGYPTCRACYKSVERFWLADWAALLEREGVAPGTDDEQLLARLIYEEHERHAWSCVNIAMALLACSECGAEASTSLPDRRGSAAGRANATPVRRRSAPRYGRRFLRAAPGM